MRLRMLFMNNPLTLIPSLFFAVALCSCGGGKGEPVDVEQQGQLWLSRARQALADSDFVEARAAIDSLRTLCAEAFDAREQGILLLDSIELAQARRELLAAEAAATRPNLDIYARDSADVNLDRARTKVRFYERKLLHDQQNAPNH